MNQCKYCDAPAPESEDLCDECYYEVQQEGERQCEFCCRPLNDHATMCPENESSFAQLMQKGYD